MKMTNSCKFYECEHCGRLKPETALNDYTFIRDDDTTFRGEACTDCAHDHEDANVTGLIHDTRYSEETLRIKRLTTKKNLVTALRDRIKYMGSKDLALRLHIEKAYQTASRKWVRS